MIWPWTKYIPIRTTDLQCPACEERFAVKLFYCLRGDAGRHFVCLCQACETPSRISAQYTPTPSKRDQKLARDVDAVDRSIELIRGRLDKLEKGRKK